MEKSLLLWVNLFKSWAKMLLATSRICARPVTFYNNFDKYSGGERPEGDI